MQKWSIRFLNASVQEEFSKLPIDIQAGIAHIIALIQENGLEHTGMPYVRHIQGKLWEIRGRGRDGIGRSLYITASGREIVIVRSFVKKTQQTPNNEVKLALKRAKDI